MLLTDKELKEVWEKELGEKCPLAKYYWSPRDLAEKIGVPATGKRVNKGTPIGVEKFFGVLESGQYVSTGYATMSTSLTPTFRTVADQERINALDRERARAFQNLQAQISIQQRQQQLNSSQYQNPLAGSIGHGIGGLGRWNSFSTAVSPITFNPSPNTSQIDVAQKYLSSIHIEREGRHTLLLGFICDRRWHLVRPTVQFHLDQNARPHSMIGPWIQWQDGQKEYQIHGAKVDEKYVMDWQKVTAREIFELTNQEVQARLIEKYGQGRFLEDVGALEVAKDEVGILCQIGGHPSYLGTWSNTLLKFVKVINSTPEPDGTYKEYILRVPPNVRTPRAGIAWTFGISEEEYQPEIET